MKFNKVDIDKISNFLSTNFEEYAESYTWKIINSENKNQFFLTISNINENFNNLSNIITIQTPQGFFELHNCNSYLIFPPDEIYFISENQNILSCLIVGRNSTCSLYSNINLDTFNYDISEIPQPLLLAAMQLSIIRTIQ
ncbi:MAG TPA: hypothetical protein PLC04_00390 [Candidatus Kapabacteria bacterium]|jgi:hypothetical protein|nr:hypothetical protein [Candidatus Kapabacteria bacterium]HOV91530.1 hypothetical protein [Candidatus Kapabacteria bacterium]